MGIGPRGVWGHSPKKFFVANPFSLPENEGNAPFRTDYSKNCLNITCKGYIKYCCYESRTSLYVSKVAAVAGGARGNERLKRPKRLNVNSNSTILRHQRLTYWDRTSFYDTEMSIRRFGMYHVDYFGEKGDHGENIRKRK